MLKILLSFTGLFFFLTIASGQSIVINEFCSQNTSFLDEDNESSDWFELYNPGNESVNLLNYSISDDSSNLLKWTFPEINLGSKNAMVVFASGKDRKELSYYKNLIQQGDTFSYAIGSSTIPSDWKEISFDDSAWSKGSSGFGFGDNDDATLIEPGVLSVFVRKTIQITNVNAISQLLLHIDYDDGFIAYLNGIEIARAYVGTNSVIPYNQTADSHEALMYNGGKPELFVIDNITDILVEGTNVLTIQVHNQSSGSSDLSLMPFLSAKYSEPVSGNPMPEILNIKNTFFHANFKISAEGEPLYLSDASGLLIDKTDSIPLPLGISFGRLLSDLKKWVYFGKPTPGNLNTTQAYDSLGTQSITFSPSGGKYSSTKQVSLSAATGSVIYYTTDGSNPTLNSLKYTTPLSLSKTTVIKAMVLNANVLSIVPSVETYIIENRDFTLPIVSLSTDPYNLFDWNYGIYELGPNAESSNPNFGANFWQDWERPINIEYFDDQGTKQLSAAGGTKIFGAWSRATPQKSMALFARSEYGSKSFIYPFFTERENDKYKSLVLRNSGNDWGSTVMRDAMMTGLVRNVDIDRQAYLPVTVFLNGDYWGILNLREKVNEDFLADNHAEVDADKVDILQNNAEVVEGSADHYNKMLSFIRTHNMSDNTNYDSVCKMMDVVNFMEYEIAQIYYDNQDWPGNNIKYWRPQTETGKWRWILYDTDFGFGIYGAQNYRNNTLEFALYAFGSDWPNPAWSTFLLRSLLENDRFKTEFINHFADRLNHEFKPATVNRFIDSLKTNIKDEIPYHIARWNNIWDWDGNVNSMKTFATQRPNYMRDHIESEFSLSGNANITVNVSDIVEGKIQVNSLLISNYPWTGKYFLENAVPVIAIPNPGYEFSHWEGNAATSPFINVSVPSSGVSLKAIFKLSEKEYNSIVINEINYMSPAESDCGDWIELYNTTDANLDISGWVLIDGAENSFTIPSGTVIPKKNYLILSRDAKKFFEVYPNVQSVVGSFDFGLGSSYDIIKLYDKTNNLVDSVTYFNEYPWPLITENQTVSLLTPYSNNEIGTNWEASIGNGTPGKDNDYFVFVPEKTLAEATIEATSFPNPAQSNATIRWTCNTPQNVKINVFNIRGELVEQVFNNLCPSGTFEETIFQYGDFKGGIYFIQINFANGLSKTMKQVKM